MASLRAATLAALFALTALVFGGPHPNSVALKSKQIATPTITSAAPFNGGYSETWEEFAAQKLGSSVMPFLSNLATISGDKLEIASSGMFTICGTPYVSKDGDKLLAMNIAGGTATIVFSSPVSSFGAYWGVAPTGCSYSQTISFAFFDADGNQVGADEALFTPSSGALEWRGYDFSVPIKKITYSGDYIVTDGMQVMMSPTYYSPSPTETPDTPTPTPTLTATPTPTDTPSATATSTPTDTPTATPVQTVETPIISPSGGMFRKKVTVRISDATPGATIYYTLDGTDPTTASPVYFAGKKNKGFKLTGVGSHTVKAKAVANGFNDSAIAAAVLDIN